MKHRAGYASLLAAAVCLLAAEALGRIDPRIVPGEVAGVAAGTLAAQALLVAAVAFGSAGGYAVVSAALLDRTADKRRRHDLRKMERAIERYRERLAETPVELEVRGGPSVNVSQRESWVELRLRYLVHPRRGQRVKNDLYERVLERFNEHPDRVSFPVSRSR